MKKIIIASIVSGLMVSSLSAELTENDASHITPQTVKNDSIFDHAADPHVLANNFSTELTENDTIDTTIEIAQNDSVSHATNPNILVTKSSDLSLWVIE